MVAIIEIEDYNKIKYLEKLISVKLTTNIFFLLDT